MNRYFALFLSISLIGCATQVAPVPQLSKTGEQRVRYCELMNLDKYIGHCYFKDLRGDINYSSVRSYVANNYPESMKTWEMIEFTHKQLSSYLEKNEITDARANELLKESFAVYDRTFEWENSKLVAEQNAANLKKGCMSLALSSALNPALASQNNAIMASRGCGTSMPVSEPTAAPTSRFTYYLKSNYVSGFNRVCVYSNGVSDYTETIGSTDLCEISINR